MRDFESDFERLNELSRSKSLTMTLKKKKTEVRLLFFGIN